MERIKTGIFGLDQLIEGGLTEKSTIVIVGSSGTGKTTFGVQFLMHGIECGEQGLYVSLEESPEQIMRESEALGFDMQKHYEKDLFFIHLKGKNFKKMIEDQLPQLVKARSDYDISTRVVIDPLTPVLWAAKDRLEQRELIGRLFYTLRGLGVVVSTVEEHTRPGETIGEDVLLPIYLADGAFHLEYYPIGGAFNRTVKVIKMRSTHHGEGVYPYMFVRGMGVVVRASAAEVTYERGGDYAEIFDKAIKTAETKQAPKPLLSKIKIMRDTWDYDYSPEEALHIVFDSYDL